MMRMLVVIAGFVIMAAAAVAHGLWTDRWGPSPDLQAAGERLANLPTQVGDWEGQAVPLDPIQVEVAQVTGYAVRHYKHRYTNTPVNVMILCGRPGPVSVHPPEACYGNAGYTPGPRRKQQLSDGGELWVADFVKSGPVPETLRISWGWSNGCDWIASDSPRTQFARSKVLYKMYLIHPLTPGAASEAPEVELELLKALTPSLRECLVPVS